MLDLKCGDALDLLTAMPSSSVDTVVTDPPYGVGLSAKKARMRDGRTSVRHGTYIHDDTPEYVRDVVVPAIEQCRRIANCVVVTPGTRNMWLYPQPDDVGCWYSASGTGMTKWGFACCQPILYYGKDPYLANRLGSRPNSCGQTYPNDANLVQHPCAKPIRFVRWLIERASLPGMTVLDPFMGSGTTGVACIELGRSFIGIELDPKYHKVASDRIEQLLATPCQGVLLQSDV